MLIFLFTISFIDVPEQNIPASTSYIGSAASAAQRFIYLTRSLGSYLAINLLV